MPGTGSGKVSTPHGRQIPGMKQHWKFCAVRQALGACIKLDGPSTHLATVAARVPAFCICGWTSFFPIQIGMLMRLHSTWFQEQTVDPICSSVFQKVLSTRQTIVTRSCEHLYLLPHWSMYLLCFPRAVLRSFDASIDTTLYRWIPSNSGPWHMMVRTDYRVEYLEGTLSRLYQTQKQSREASLSAHSRRFVIPLWQFAK